MGLPCPVQKNILVFHFPACAILRPRLKAQLPWACSSVVEHCVDIAGVASSILATPTMTKPVTCFQVAGFLFCPNAAAGLRALRHRERADKMAGCEIVAGKRLLFVMAADAEYGRHLRARFTPLMTGVGPVEAAMATGITLHDMARDNGLPDLVVCLGSAGSRICGLGEIVQVASVSWRDMDASRLGFTKGVTPFVDHPVDLPLATPLAIPSARLSTGANIVGGNDYAAIDADMVDMETFAVARACARFDVALMGLRGISDRPGELDHINGWMELLELLDARLAAAVDLLLEALANDL